MSDSLNTTIAVRSCADYKQAEVYSAVCGLFDLLGGVERFISPRQRVLIKPNLIAPKTMDAAAQTHPEVIFAAAKIVKDVGAIPLVGDSSAWGNARKCLQMLGVDKRLESLGAEIVQLDRPVRVKLDGTTVGVSRVALQADAIINLPKLKAHQQLGATFAIKNMYGCVAGLGGKEKAYWHFARGREKEQFCRLLVGIYRHLNPVINIIDGIVGMEGQGPLSGQPQQVGYLVAGVNPVACERICCELVGFDPAELPLVIAACDAGIGSLTEPLDILGDTYDIPACEFKPAIQTPLRFSFPHICKSITKQGVILLKDCLKRTGR